MYESKLVQFLQEKVMNRPPIKKHYKTLPFNSDNKSNNKDNQTFKYNTIHG